MVRQVSADFGITVEGFNGNPPNGVDHLLCGHVIENNVLEDCAGGIGVVDWYAWSTKMERAIFTDITIEGNYILDSGMGGWAHQQELTISEETGSLCYLAPIVLCMQPGCEDITVKNNTLYRTWKPSSLVTYGYIEGFDCVDFSGNTYVQNPYGYSVWLWRCIKDAEGAVTANYEWFRNEIGVSTAEILGDATGIAPEPVFKLPEAVDMSGENRILSAELSDDATVRVVFKNEDTGILVAVGYEESGRLLSLCTQAVSEVGSVWAELPMKKGCDKVKVFFVDGSFTPLCEELLL